MLQYIILISISIHALRGEGDTATTGTRIDKEDFNPRPPWGGRRGAAMLKQITQISIHALRGEGDPAAPRRPEATRHFNPRPPWGGRRTAADMSDSTRRNFNPRPPWGGRHFFSPLSIRPLCPFQSTPSVGRATAKIYKYAMLCLYIVHIKLYIFATAVLFI